MTIFYVRPGTGSDTNNGLTPASAWKTLTNNASVLQPGDEVRIEASPVYSVASTSTWNFGSSTITVPIQLTLNLFLCESSFTAAMQSGVSLGTSSICKQGNVSSSITIPSGAVGPLAYRTLSAINASGFQQVCFWIRSNVELPANVLALDLCSDTIGQAPISSCLIAYPLKANRWTPIVVDNNAALPSLIQSIRLTALNVLSTGMPVTILLDNIFCARSPTSANTVTLHSLVGHYLTTTLPFGELFFPVRFVTQSGSQTIIGFDGGINDSPTTPSGRSPITHTALALYRIDPFILSPSLTPTQDTDCPWGIVTANGTPASPVTISGGWDKVSMSSQSALTPTVMMCVSSTGEGLRCFDSSFLRISTLRFSNFAYGVVFQGLHTALSDVHAYRAFKTSFITKPLSTGQEPITILRRFYAVGGAITQMGLTCGKTVAAYGVLYSAPPNFPSITVQPVSGHRPNVEFQRIYAWDCDYPLLAASDVLIRGGDFSVLRRNSSFAVRLQPLSVFEPKIILCDCQFGSSAIAADVIGMDYTNFQVRFHQPNHALLQHRIILDNGVIEPDTTVYQTPPHSWRFTTNAKAREAYPMIMPLGPFWRQQGPSPADVSVVVRRSHAAIQVRVRLFGGQISTIAANQPGLAVLDTGPINTWNTVTVPISNLVSSGTFDMQVEVWTTDGGAHTCWIDKII